MHRSRYEPISLHWVRQILGDSLLHDTRFNLTKEGYLPFRNLNCAPMLQSTLRRVLCVAFNKTPPVPLPVDDIAVTQRHHSRIIPLSIHLRAIAPRNRIGGMLQVPCVVTVVCQQQQPLCMEVQLSLSKTQTDPHTTGMMWHSRPVFFSRSKMVRRSSEKRQLSTTLTIHRCDKLSVEFVGNDNASSLYRGKWFVIDSDWVFLCDVNRWRCDNCSVQTDTAIFYQTLCFSSGTYSTTCDALSNAHGQHSCTWREHYLKLQNPTCGKKQTRSTFQIEYKLLTLGAGLNINFQTRVYIKVKNYILQHLFLTLESFNLPLNYLHLLLTLSLNSWSIIHLLLNQWFLHYV